MLVSITQIRYPLTYCKAGSATQALKHWGFLNKGYSPS